MPSKIWLSSILSAKDAKLLLLGGNAKLEWERVGNGFIANISESIQNNLPCHYAWTVMISVIQ